MNSPVLTITNLAKSFCQYPSHAHRILSWLGLPLKRFNTPRILNDISFSLLPGESVGIVGVNGAGKSTLLKLITGTLSPTQGSITIQGKISAILELGMGFHAEFTGHQNALFSLGLLGVSRKEIDRILPEIETFCELGNYFNQPLRTYSSGMQMRLAFAIATAIRPDLLIVDEALSVGDGYFQHKCFERIKKFQKQGTSLLLVSHDPFTITAMCRRVILLDKGSILKDGDPETVMNYYNALLSSKEKAPIETPLSQNEKIQIKSGTGEASIESISLLNHLNQPAHTFHVGDLAILRIDVVAHEDLPYLTLGYAIKDLFGQYVYGTNTHHTRQSLINVKKGQYLTFHIRFPMNLGPGTYSITTALTPSERHGATTYEWKDIALLFSVTNINMPHFIGTAWVQPEIEVAIR